MGIKLPIYILVVGGSGFIGGAVVKHAVSLGWKVESLGLSVPSRAKKVPTVKYIKADITDSKTLRILASNKYQYVVNAGGYIDHASLHKGGQKIIETHLGGVANLVENINRDKLIRFINIGSSDEYGNTPAPQSETFREHSISPYSFAKLAATHFLQMLYRSEQFPAVTLRLFLCYGPGQGSMRFLPHLVSRCLRNADIEVSPGDQIRDYCFIDDVVEAVFLSMACEDANGRVLNIASGEPVSIKQLVEKVVKVIGAGNPLFGVVPYRDGESMNLYAEVSLAKKVMNWSAKTSLEHGLYKTIAYYTKHIKR